MKEVTINIEEGYVDVLIQVSRNCIYQIIYSECGYEIRELSFPTGGHFRKGWWVLLEEGGQRLRIEKEEIVRY